MPGTTPRRTVLRLLTAALLAVSAPVAYSQTVLKFATTLPPSHPLVSGYFDGWAKRVNEAAGGEFQVQVVNGPTIANGVNVWERTVNGVVDIGWGIQGGVNLPFPKTNIMGLPLLVEENQAAAASVALWRLYASGLIADEYKDVRPIALVASPVQGLSTKGPVAKLEDVKGLKIRASDKSVADIVTALGGSPISVPAAEVYQALSQGVVSGSVAGAVLITSFKLNELVKHHVEGIPMGAPAGFIVMNRQAYEKLSPKGKQVLDRFTGETMSREFGTFFMELGLGAAKQLRSAKDQQFVSLPAQEKARWVSALEPVIQAWVKATPQGDKVLASFRADVKAASAR